MSLKNRLQAIFMMLVFFGLWPASASALFDQDFTDEKITVAIESDLYVDEGVSSHLIDVSVNRGIVALSGSVDNLLAKERAILIAQNIRGVRSIIDKIEVVPVQRDDEEIKNDIQKAMVWDPAVDKKEVDVEVDSGRVILKGEVDSWQEKQLAGEVARGVVGVRAVSNQIEFKYKANRPDDEIQADIQRRLESNVEIYQSLIRVSVENGNVTLEGSVSSLAEKQRAGLLAWVAGVKKVDNSNLQVNPGMARNINAPRAVELKTDDQVQSSIQEAFLLDSRVNPFDIEVNVDRGVVTLKGVVDNVRAKKSAERDARLTTGVREVINKLKVRPKENSKDTDLTQHIKDALAFHPFIDRYKINVIVRNKKANLYGVVDNAFDKKRVEDVVSRISGVAEINNQLSIQKSWPFKSDEEIRENIEDEYFWSVYVDGDDIFVSVEDGKAYLSGQVDSWSEMQAAVKNAFEGGARLVETHLRAADGSKKLLRYQFDYKDLDVAF